MDLLTKSKHPKLVNPTMSATDMQKDQEIKRGAYEIWLRYYKKVFISEKMKIFVEAQQKLNQVTPPSYLDYRTHMKITTSWLKSVREALFLNVTTVSNKINSSRSAFSHLERNEISGKITLNKLREAAAAINCDLVYGLVPKGTLTPAEQIWETLYPSACNAKFVENATRQQRMHGIATAAKHLMEDLNFRAQCGWSTRSEVSDFGEFRKLSRLDAEKLMKAKASDADAQTDVGVELKKF
jgi:hypothetical protein